MTGAEIQHEVHQEVAQSQNVRLRLERELEAFNARMKDLIEQVPEPFPGEMVRDAEHRLRRTRRWPWERS